MSETTRTKKARYECERIGTCMPAYDELAKLERELTAEREQLAERDAEIGTLQAVIADLRAALAGVKGSYSALREHADRLAYVLGEGNAVNAYRAAYPKE